MIIFNQLSNKSFYRFIIFLFSNLIMNFCLASDDSPVLPLNPVNSYVCQNNDYALCSHAKCTCLNDNGQEGECLEYDKYKGENPDSGWSRCECPRVIQSELAEKSPYKANFASLDCQELAKPSDKGTAFPSFAGQQVAEVYSTYSFGDSLPGDIFKTKNAAKLKLCDTQPLMALCLDMPCKTEIIDGKEVTACYCQNVSLDSCDSGAWNTLGTDCETNKCNPGSNKVWSAACVTKTLGGISDLLVSIRKDLDKEFTDIPAFCSK